MTYTVSADKIVRKKTIATFLMFTALTLGNLFQYQNWIWQVSFFAFFMIILSTSYLLKPSNYEIDSQNIIIHRLIGDVKINLQQIARVDRIHHDLLKETGKGGLFGYFGKVYTFLGKTNFYATRRNNLVLITKKDNTKIILTPDEQDGFIEQIENSI
jgi:hypothetical protein